MELELRGALLPVPVGMVPSLRLGAFGYRVAPRARGGGLGCCGDGLEPLKHEGQTEDCSSRLRGWFRGAPVVILFPARAGMVSMTSYDVSACSRPYADDDTALVASVIRPNC
ncbi:hypothetical protein AMK27_37370 [Streptomyces sp. CB02009]|nr:hypothetical protein AMK27_37370 [Streptomyces sp. CB02009]